MSNINSQDTKTMLKEKLLKMKKQIQKTEQQQILQQRKTNKKGQEPISGQINSDINRQSNSQFNKPSQQINKSFKREIQLKEGIIQKPLVQTISFKKGQPSTQFAPQRKQSQYVINKAVPIRNLNEINKLSDLPERKISDAKSQDSKKQPAICLPAREREQNQPNSLFDYFPTFITTGELIDLKVCTLSEIVDYFYAQKIIVEQDYHSYLFNKDPQIEENYLQKIANKKFQEFTFNKTRFTLLDHRRLAQFLNKLSPSKYRLGERSFNIHPDITNFLQQIYRLPGQDYWDICSKVDEKYSLKWWKDIMKKFQVCTQTSAMPKEKYKNQQKNQQKDQSDNFESISQNSDISEKMFDLNLDDSEKGVDNKQDGSEDGKKEKKSTEKRQDKNQKQAKQKINNKTGKKEDDEEEDDEEEEEDDEEDEEDDNDDDGELEDSFNMPKSDYSLGELGGSSEGDDNIFGEDQQDQSNQDKQKGKDKPKPSQDKPKSNQNSKKEKVKDDDFFSSLDQDQLGEQFVEDDVNLGSDLDDNISLSIGDNQMNSDKPKKDNKNKQKNETKNQKKQKKDDHKEKNNNSNNTKDASKSQSKSKTKKIKKN